DCNGNPVQNGYMKVSDGTFIYNTHYYPIINGQSSGSYVTCSSSLSTTVTGIDIDNLKESSPINLIGIGPHNLGIVSVCGITPDYLSVNCPGLGIINEVIFELTAVDSNDIKTIYSNENSSNIVKKLFFIYKDASISSYATGTFNIVNADFLYVPTSNYYDLVNGTVTITQGGTSGNTLIGTYNMVMKNAVTMTQESFSGSFQTKL
ncbi:MAG TPA: hypothetical protein VK590_09800, partial [Saprospiraceae bacterium]|nr:hypothetical protein [Saprospiraceae bacterium]